MSTSPENKYRNWVFTWNESDAVDLPEVERMELFLKDEFELYVFQLESGDESHRLHYQGAFRTQIRVRQSTLLSKFKSFFQLEAISSLTINRMCGDWDENFAYCTKADTRVGEQFFSSSSLKKYSGRDIKFLSREDLWFPWQTELMEILFEKDKSSVKIADDRKIYWYSDHFGNCGKSKFVKFLCFNNSAITKLSFGTAAQLRSSVVAAGPKLVYLIDIPRTLGSDDSIASIISVIEDIKNGFVVSSMYGKHTTLMMEPPHIVCFSNEKHPKELMSLDRWEPFQIDRMSKIAYGKEFFNDYY